MPDTRPDPAAPSATGVVLVNARVHTGDPRRPWVDAVLVRDGMLVAVGASAELRKRAGPAALVIDAKGLLALPRTAGELLRAGAPANLVLVERTAEVRPGDDRVVFVLEGERIVLDRLGLAGEPTP